MKTTIRTTSLLISVLVGGSLLAGCASTSAPPKSTTAATAPAETQIAVKDTWVKSAKKDEMTAVFGTVTNTTDHDVTLVAASTKVSDMVQLHETTEDGSGGMSMKEKKGGFTIPAGGTLSLEPGGNHIMLMGLKLALDPGVKIDVRLTFKDGTTKDVTAVVKDYTGANEKYSEGEGGSMDHGSMDHGTSDGGSGSDH